MASLRTRETAQRFGLCVLVAVLCVGVGRAQDNFFFNNVEPQNNFTNSTSNTVDPLASIPVNNSVVATENSAVEEVAVEAAAGTDPAVDEEELVTIDFRSTQLGDVLRTLASSSRFNLVIGTSVDQTLPVTLQLNDVTYKTALETVLGIYGLRAESKNNIVKIESIQHVVTELNLRETLQSTEWNSQPTRVLVWQLNYAAASDISSLITQMVQSRFGQLETFSISVDERLNKIVVESIPDVLERVKALLKALDVKRRQVLIKARIVEASKELSRTLGVTWGTRFGLDGQRGLSTGTLFPNFLVGSVGGAGSVGDAAPQPGTGLGPTQLGATALSLGSINGLINLDAVIRAYETESMAHVVASPTIVVEDQDQATIQETTTINRETVAGDQVVNTQASFELTLEVVPRVSRDGNVQMEIQVTRGTPGTAAGSGSQVNTIIARNANTNLTVADGETAVIGGLYQSSRIVGTGRVPILGDLPIIGALFRTRAKNVVRTELMVMITPRILKEKIGQNSELDLVDEDFGAEDSVNGEEVGYYDESAFTNNGNLSDADFNNSGNNGFNNSGNNGFNNSGNNGFNNSENNGFNNSENNGFNNSGNNGFNNSGNNGFNNSGNNGFNNNENFENSNENNEFAENNESFNNNSLNNENDFSENEGSNGLNEEEDFENEFDNDF